MSSGQLRGGDKRRWILCGTGWNRGVQRIERHDCMTADVKGYWGLLVVLLCHDSREDTRA